MTEREFQDAVLELARTFGWRRAHFRPARTAAGWRTPMQGDVGFPDLVLVHADTGTLIVRELKAARGKVSDAQIAWIDAFEACGVDAGVWRPSDWPQIAHRLSFGRATVGIGPR